MTKGRIGIALVVLIAGIVIAANYLRASTGFVNEGPLVVHSPRKETKGVLVGGVLLSGDVQLAGDCVLVGGNAAVWPKGTSWNGDDSSVVLPDGEEVPMGSRVSGGGVVALEAQDRSPDWKSSELGSIIGGCLDSDNYVLVFNIISDIEVESP